MKAHPLKKAKLLLPILLLFGSGCEEVIDLDLNEAGPALVIEADLSVPDGSLKVTVSKTGSYYDPGSVQKVDDALVFLEHPNGGRHNAEAKGNGIYRLDQVLAAPGDKFRLVAEVGGARYTAESTVQPPVEIDTITYSYYDGDKFFRPGYRFNVSFSDPPGKKNYYRIRVYKNNYLFNRVQDLVVFNDSDHDGKTITVKLHSQYYLQGGETVMLELMSIDRKAWEYFTTFADLINAGPGSPAPANPVSSFTNGAQGYFYTWTYSRKQVTVEEVNNLQ